MYESKAKITKISALSRCAVKIKDNYYTIEYSEERVLPESVDDIDIEKERTLLWQAVNAEVDNQIQDIIDSFKRN